MNLENFFKTKKFILLNIFLSIYIFTNLIGGERGAFSYFEKKNYEQKLTLKELKLTNEILDIKNKNKLLSNNLDLDYLDKLYREKLKFGKDNEIIIKLK
jgi:cell division protein FtsB